MKKTELVQFKEEYESAVRNVDEIINNPYTAILLKYKKAEESNYCIKFRQYALRYWGQLHGVDFSEFGDKDITVDEFNHALSMAQIEKKTDFEGGGGNAENNIIDQIKRVWLNRITIRKRGPFRSSLFIFRILGCAGISL